MKENDKRQNDKTTVQRASYLVRLDVRSPAEAHGLDSRQHVAAVALDDGPVEDGRRRRDGLVAEALADKGAWVHSRGKLAGRGDILGDSNERVRGLRFLQPSAGEHGRQE